MLACKNQLLTHSLCNLFALKIDYCDAGTLMSSLILYGNYHIINFHLGFHTELLIYVL